MATDRGRLTLVETGNRSAGIGLKRLAMVSDEEQTSEKHENSVACARMMGASRLLKARLVVHSASKSIARPDDDADMNHWHSSLLLNQHGLTAEP